MHTLKKNVLLDKFGLKYLKLKPKEFNELLAATMVAIEQQVIQSPPAKIAISVNINGYLTEEDQSRLLNHIKRATIRLAKSYIGHDWFDKVFYVHFRIDEYSFKLVEYNRTVVTTQAGYYLIGDLPTLEDTVKKRTHDDLTALVRIEIEEIIAREMIRAIDLRKPSVQVHFKKNYGIAISIDTVLYNELRPKDYKYIICETNDEYIVCVQLTYNEVFNDEI